MVVAGGGRAAGRVGGKTHAVGRCQPRQKTNQLGLSGLHPSRSHRFQERCLALLGT